MFFFFFFWLTGLNTTQTIQWVADATNAARGILGTNKIITHAPQPPYFGISLLPHMPPSSLLTNYILYRSQ
jgi:hypothetical protein